MGYRADLDGLRAIAVLLVLGYHALLPGFAQGFLGVDIFFVLSGYLIAQGIFAQMAQGRFCLRGFYARRLRRILPALVLMLLLTALAACLLLYPPELKAFAQSLLAASLQLSNLHFMAVTDYFAEGNSANPLLHTWSLGVETQFYLLFPLLCLTLYAKDLRRFGPWLAVIAGLSFALSLWHGHAGDAAGFFSPLSRGWQFLSGALLACRWLPEPKRASRGMAGLMGLGLIGAAVVSPPLGAVPAPGALPVTLGACLLVWSGQGPQGIIQRVLSLKPLVFFGLISYSLYLWHWPILRLADRPLIDALASFGLLQDLSAGVLRLVLLALSFGVAVLSWHFIEKPFRYQLADWQAFGLMFSGSAFAALCAAMLITFQGWPQRFPAEVRHLASYLNAPHPEYREHQCFLTSRSRGAEFQAQSCLAPPQGWALLGDSHAAHLAHGMRRHFGRIGQITASGCKPFLLPPPLVRTPCQRLMMQAYADWLWPPHIKGVVIAARWRAGDEAPLALATQTLRARGLKVHVIGPQPQYYYEVPLILASRQQGPPLELPRLRALDQSLAAHLPQGSYHSVFKQFCPDGPCPLATATGRPLAFDYSHLTAEGSALVVKALAQDPGFPREAPR